MKNNNNLMTIKDLKLALDNLNIDENTYVCINDGYEIEDILLDVLEFPDESIEYVQLKCSSLYV